MKEVCKSSKGNVRFRIKVTCEQQLFGFEAFNLDTSIPSREINIFCIFWHQKCFTKLLTLLTTIYQLDARIQVFSSKF